MLPIKIPQPCHQDWNQMTPTPRGAFCTACSKEVVDFTTMRDEDVKTYLLSRAGEKLCGKFSNDQLDRIRILIPGKIFQAKIARWKKFLAAIMLAFGSMLFGCDVTTEQPAQGISSKMTDPARQIIREDNMAGIVGGLSFSDSTYFTPPPGVNQTFSTIGVTFSYPDDIMDLSMLKTDSLPNCYDSTQSLAKNKPDSLRTCSPQKDSSSKASPVADSVNCEQEHFY